MYWEPELETMPRQTLEALQIRRLRQTLRTAIKSPYYGHLHRQGEIVPASIKTVNDIRRLPLTTKDDLRAHYPHGFLCVDRKATVRLHCSSGTTGNPTVIFHTQHDINSWANLVARCLYAVGARDTDVFQNICGYGLFTGGLGFQYGAERLGALTIPAGAGNSRRQIKLMQDHGTTVVHTIPSYMTRLHAVFAELGLDPARDTRLRLLVIGAEPHTEETRQRIQQLFHLKAFNSYGLTEMNGPGVAFECTHQAGMHLWEDAYIAEILDPDTLEPVPDGDVGELVMTTLDRRAMPLIRYRTRDLTRVIPGPCTCGRTHRRIDRIVGRSDDMFIIRGCNVFPMQIEGVLMRVSEVGHDYLITLVTENGVDDIIVDVELREQGFSDDRGALERLAKRITHEVRDEILVTPKVRLVEPGSLPKAEGKAVRVKDLRAGRCLQ